MNPSHVELLQEMPAVSTTGCRYIKAGRGPTRPRCRVGVGIEFVQTTYKRTLVASEAY